MKARTLLITLLLSTLTPAAAQYTVVAPPPDISGVYGSAGLGFINLEKGVGLNIPLGLTVVSERYRLIATGNALDFGLFEGGDRDTRYVRQSFGLGGGSCVDLATRLRVSDFHCSGSTAALRSASADLNFIAVNELWLGDHPARLFVGGGYRFLNPATPYFSAGLYAASRSGFSGGFKIAMGEEYIFLGIVWGIDMRKIFNRF